MSVAGKWQVSMDTPLGKQNFTWDVEQTGSGYRGSMQSQAGASPLADIAVNGEDFSFGARVDSPMGSLQVEFNGTASGAKVSGTCKTKFGDFRFAGDRL